MIAIISDIHGNHIALKEVLKAIDELSITEIYCLGDVIGYYPQVNECCDELRKRSVKCIMGNHDWYMVAGSFCPRSKSVNDCLTYQRKVITKDNLTWLGTFPFYRVENSISMVHGGWTNPIDEYLEPSEEYFHKLEGKYFISGHSHIQSLNQFKNAVYCNPGAVGQPRDGNPMAAFAIFNGENFKLHRVAYDVNKIGQLMEEAGFSGYYYGCLKTGARNLQWADVNEALDVHPKREVKTPLVRVCLLTYNHVKFIKHCLDGILMQKTDFPLEIYIYDDCSTDGTSDIIREYAQKYSNIIVDVQPENYYSKDRELWLKHHLNSFKNHNCKYVAFVEGDDYWIDPYKLQIQVNFLESNNDFSMRSGGYLVNDSFCEWQQIELIDNGNLSGVEYNFQKGNSSYCLMKNLTRLYRTSAIPDYRTIAQRYKFWCDSHLAYYVLSQGKGFYFFRVFGVYNIHSGVVWSTLDNEQKKITFYNIYKELYRETQDIQIKNLLLVTEEQEKMENA